MVEQYAQRIVVKIFTYLLLIFIIFSLGYAVGKEFALREKIKVQEPIESVKGNTVVFYLRSTFRCWQCNMIELYTDELIRDEFAEVLESGLLQWRVVDYLQNRELANRYNVSGNTVIVQSYVEGMESEYTRLDQVMEKVFNQEEFNDYIRKAIYNHLSGLR